MPDDLVTYGFAGVRFSPKADEQMPRVDPYVTYTSERHVPYSSLTVFDIGGRAGARHYKQTVRISPANEDAFEALLLATGDLTVDGRIYPGSTLLSLTKKTMTPRREYFYFDAEWLVP